MSDEDSDDDQTPFAEPASNWLADQWEEEHERPRGIFTDTDRQFLEGIIEYEHENTAINRRADIRDRVKHGLLDLSYLGFLEERDRDKVLADLDDDRLHDTLTAFIAFLVETFDGDLDRLERIIETGVFNAQYDTDGDDMSAQPRSVHVSIDVEFLPDADDVYRRFQEHGFHSLTPEEIGVLVMKNKLTQSDLEQAQQYGLGRPDDPLMRGQLSDQSIPDEDSTDDIDE